MVFVLLYCTFTLQLLFRLTTFHVTTIKHRTRKDIFEQELRLLFIRLTVIFFMSAKERIISQKMNILIHECIHDVNRPEQRVTFTLWRRKNKIKYILSDHLMWNTLEFCVTRWYYIHWRFNSYTVSFFLPLLFSFSYPFWNFIERLYYIL